MSILGIRRPRGLIIVSGVIGLAGLALSFAVASERTPQDSRSAPVKKELNETQQVVSRSEESLVVDYKVMVSSGGNREVWVNVGNDATGYTGYLVKTVSDTMSFAPLPIDQADINPENFVRMSGTRKGMAAIALALSQMLAEEPPFIHQVKARKDLISSRVDGIALFEAAGTVHILSVRFEDDEPVFEDIGFVAAGCIASLNPLAGGCSCTASQGGTCKGNGTNKVTCTDSAGTMSCSGSGGVCNCAAD